MTPLRGSRHDAVHVGYEAPFRKSLIDPDTIMGCPRFAILGLIFVCGLLYLQFLPGLWWQRALISGGLFLVGFVGMTLLTRRDPQWLEVASHAMTDPDSLES